MKTECGNMKCGLTCVCVEVSGSRMMSAGVSKDVSSISRIDSKIGGKSRKLADSSRKRRKIPKVQQGVVPKNSIKKYFKKSETQT